MATEIRNLPIEQAQAELAEQLSPRSEAPSGTRSEGDYEEATAEVERLENLYQSGHDGPKSKS